MGGLTASEPWGLDCGAAEQKYERTSNRIVFWYKFSLSALAVM